MGFQGVGGYSGENKITKHASVGCFVFGFVVEKSQQHEYFGGFEHIYIAEQ